MIKTPALIRRLRQKIFRSRSMHLPPSTGDASESAETVVANSRPDAEAEDQVPFVDPPSRVMYMRQADSIIAVLASTQDLVDRLRAAIRQDSRVEDAERAFAPLREDLLHELDTVRAEGQRHVDDGVRTSARLDELEARDDAIARELEAGRDDMRQLCCDAKKRLRDICEELAAILEEDGLYATAREAKKENAQAGERAEGTSRSRTGPYRLATALSSDIELLDVIFEAVRNNQHMKQLERRVSDLDEEQRQVAAKIQNEEAPFQQEPGHVSDIKADPMRLQHLKRQCKEIAVELNRYQADAEAKWIVMRQGLRALLDYFFDLLVQSGEMDQYEGLRDIDNEPPLLVQYRDQNRDTTAQRALSLLGKAKSVSVKASKAQGFERPQSRLSKKGKTVHDLKATVEDFERELSEYRAIEQQLLHDYVSSKREVDEAQRHFGLADARHLQEEKQFQAQLAAGADVGSDTSFDLRLLLDKQRLTRNLIEAEENFQAVKVKAVEEGVYLDDGDRSSGFVSLASDGYGESREAEEQGNIKPGVFVDWMKAIPIMGCVVEKAPERPEVDEWDAKMVEIWDSVSVRAKGSDRRRIDRWLRRER